MNDTQKLYQSAYVTPYQLSQFNSSMPTIDHENNEKHSNLIPKGRDNTKSIDSSSLPKIIVGNKALAHEKKSLAMT